PLLPTLFPSTTLSRSYSSHDAPHRYFRHRPRDHGKRRKAAPGTILPHLTDTPDTPERRSAGHGGAPRTPRTAGPPSTGPRTGAGDRKSTRLNSSHVTI